MPPRRDPDAPVIAPFEVLRDTQEKKPYLFEGLRTDACQGRRPLLVPVIDAKLRTGDYSILGMEDMVTVERKSKDDFFRTIGQERASFKRELARMQEIKHATVIVEAEWSEIRASPPEFSKMRVNNLFRTVIHWMSEFRNVHWVFMPSRREAEIATYRRLEVAGKKEKRKLSVSAACLRE